MIFFITGTDTGVGKTHVTTVLQQHFKAEGKSVIAMKPIASGCDFTEWGLRNDDALALMVENSIELPYDWINPYAFSPPIAPHIAAEEMGLTLSVAAVAQKCRLVLNQPVDVHLIEGVGGWSVPLNQHESMAELPLLLNAEVILVVGMSIGCLNHALLTHGAITASGCKIAGWIANEVMPDMDYLEENLDFLQAKLSSPFLGRVGFGLSALEGNLPR